VLEVEAFKVFNLYISGGGCCLVMETVSHSIYMCSLLIPWALHSMAVSEVLEFLYDASVLQIEFQTE
jgi:hypothetical protein